MKIIRFLLTLAALSFAPLFGQTAPATPATTVAPTQSKGDAVLDFILKKAEKYSGSLEEGISQAVDFAKEQTPQTVVEFLKWRMAKAIVWASVNLVGFLCVIGFLIFTYRFCKKHHEGSEGCIWFAGAIMLFFSIFAISSILDELVNNVLVIIQIHVAPRVYLIEEAMKLVKH